MRGRDTRRAPREGQSALGFPDGFPLRLSRLPMTTNTFPVGLVGLGPIGLALTHRLLASGRAVMGYRRSPSRELVDLGGQDAASVADLAARCETILLALPDGAACLGVLEAIIASAPDRRLVINTTSTPPTTAVALARLVEEQGHGYLEAPVSGAPHLVRAHGATLLVGGDEALFATQRSFLLDLAAHVTRVGEAGAASAVKSAALLMMVVNTLGAAEALAFAESFGVAAGCAIEALAAGPASSAALSMRGPWMAERAYQPRIGTLTAFDALVGAIQADASTPTLMLAQARGYFARAIEAGLGDLDAAAVYEMIRQKPGR